MARIRRDTSADGSVVYSSGPDGTRGVPSPDPAPAQAVRSAGSADGIVRVSRTKAGRKGKTVTLVTGLPPADLRDIARELKRLCGSGGAVKDGVVEVQGDHRDAVAAHLGARYRVTIAGG